MTVTSKDLSPGTVVAWKTWTGAEATATVAIVEPFPGLDHGSPGMYWEATFARSLDESLAATKGLRVVS
jgi:hypothetical protein